MPTFSLPAALRAPASMTRLRAAVELGLVLLLAMQAARLTWLLLTPLGPVADGAAEAPAYASLPSNLAGPDPFYRGAQAAGTDGNVAGWTLYGLRTGEDGGAAILAGPDGVQSAYRVGDTLAPGLTLLRVEAGHAVLGAGGVEHRLRLPETPAASPAAAAAPAATAAASPTADHARLLEQVSLRPQREGERVLGYELVARGDDAALRQAGLMPGDVLLEVDGAALTPERVGELRNELASRAQVTLTVRRGAQTLTLTLPARQP